MTTSLNAFKTLAKCIRPACHATFLAAVLCIAVVCELSAGDDYAGSARFNRMTSDSVNMPVEAFYSLLTSPIERERQKAECYLLGVLDTTEGRSWGDYHTLKTITIREHIFEYFKKLAKHRYKERASAVIEEALNSTFACKGEK